VGIVVLGYDHTAYARRSSGSVVADINSYKSWYNVNGIFFDEMSNVPGNENYYSSLNRYAKSLGFSFTVGNPGASVPSSYVGTLDVIVTYENEGVPNSASLASMTNGMPKNNFAVISYGVNTWDASAVGNIFNYASYVYVTNNTLPNPYGAVSGDLSKLVALVGSLTQTQTSVPLTVKSDNTEGTPILGLWTVIQSTNGSVVTSGYTTQVHTVRSGAGYLVSVSNYGSFVFDHWDNGGTNPVRTLTVTQETTLTAYFRSIQPIQKQTLAVRSLTLSGASIEGLWTVIQSGGNTIATGFTPLSYSGTVGTKYTASVSNYGNYVFDHWDDGTTNPARTVTLTQSETLTAYFRPTTASITVQSVDSKGTPLNGMRASVTSSNGNSVTTGFTPLAFTGTPGTQYTVSIGNYGGYVFDHWDDGTTNPARTVTVTQDTTLTAYFRPPVPTTASITVQSVDSKGTPFNGMWASVTSSNGNSVTTGFTPLAFTGTPGTQYTVSIGNYGGYVFDHWDDGTTNPARTVTVTQDTTLTAYYSTSSSITVKSVTLNGAPITGLWTVITLSDGTPVASSFTPLSFTGTNGATYTITMSNYGIFVFDHWSDGSTNPVRTLTVMQETTLTAYYSPYGP
jgi:hypothetical protein